MILTIVPKYGMYFSNESTNNIKSEINTKGVLVLNANLFEISFEEAIANIVLDIANAKINKPNAHTAIVPPNP